MFRFQNPYSLLLANLVLTLDSGIGNNSRKALLTVPDTLYVATNISHGDDEDKGDNDDYAGPCINVGEEERNKTHNKHINSSIMMYSDSEGKRWVALGHGAW